LPCEPFTMVKDVDRSPKPEVSPTIPVRLPGSVGSATNAPVPPGRAPRVEASNDTPTLPGALTLERAGLYSGRHFPKLLSLEVRA